jgi:hypothetical protein
VSVGPPPAPEEAAVTIDSIITSQGLSKTDLDRIATTFERLAEAARDRLALWDDDDSLADIIAHDADVGLPGFKRVCPMCDGHGDDPGDPGLVCAACSGSGEG